jgi:hypothetical protein
MRMQNRIALAIFLVWSFAAVYAQGKSAKDAPKPYLGEKPPKGDPVVFSPGLVSVPGRYVNGLCLSEDGKECYFTVRNASWSTYEIMETRWEDGAWTEPERASFSDGRSMAPALADGDGTMYFSRGQDIWMSKWNGGGWDEAEKAKSPLSSAQAEYSCHISSEGVAWICSHRPGGSGACDIWIAKACCGGFGGSDIYLSRPDGKGGWTAPVNAGPLVNTAASEVSPYVSPDGKCLFFTRNAANEASVY